MEIIPKEMQVLSLSSHQDTPKDMNIEVGLSAKPVFKYGMLLRIEVLFVGAGNKSVLQAEVLGIDAEVIHMPPPILVATQS
jgi:hypothetical protein